MKRFAAILMATMGVSLALSSQASASSGGLSLQYGSAGHGKTVLRISGPSATRSVIVAWGDGRRTLATRRCDDSSQTPAARGDGEMAFPHFYRRNGSFLVSAQVTSAGCTNPQTTVGPVASRRVRVTGSKRPPAGATASDVAPTAPGSSSPSPPTHWVSFNQPCPLANSTFKVQVGTPTAPTPNGPVQTTPGATGTASPPGSSSSNTGCSFPGGNLTLGPRDPHAIEQREVAVEPDTCQALVQTGTPPAWSLKQGPPPGSGLAGGGFTSPFAPDSRAPGSGSVATASATHHASGYLRSWWEDPVGIDVNVVRNSTDWHYNGSCVVAPVSGRYAYAWYSPSGWSLKGNNWRNYYTCYHSISGSYAHFHNGTFCAFFDVDTYYDRSTVGGHYNGVLAGSWNSYNTGAVCKSLLSFHRTLAYYFNY
jgi:hypothetical protein